MLRCRRVAQQSSPNGPGVGRPGGGQGAAAGFGDGDEATTGGSGLAQQEPPVGHAGELAGKPGPLPAGFEQDEQGTEHLAAHGGVRAALCGAEYGIELGQAFE
ncbi:hypothetical protein P3T37_006244 [Kitasatospora sp. MAA4]|nr:hypothetical protein [Kitasatospora sp. MAA4]